MCSDPDALTVSNSHQSHPMDQLFALSKILSLAEVICAGSRGRATADYSFQNSISLFAVPA